MRQKYEYCKIVELGGQKNKLVNFYAKIYKVITGGDDQWTLELEDETGIAKVLVNGFTKKDKFEENQIIRIHRGLVYDDSFKPLVLVNIGKSGCHFVVWSSDGEKDPESPIFISSKNWTQEAFDKKYLAALNRLRKEVNEKDTTTTIDHNEENENPIQDQPSTSNAVAINAIPDENTTKDDYCVLETICDQILTQDRIAKVCKDFLATITLPTQESEMKQLFELNVGDPFYSGIFYKVEPFDYAQFGSSFLWTVHCPSCEDDMTQFPYISRGNEVKRCHLCKKAISFESSVQLSIRVNISIPGFNIIYTFSVNEMGKLDFFNSREKLLEIWKMKPDEYKEWCEKIFPEIEKFFSSVKICCSKGILNSKVNMFRCVEINVEEVLIYSIKNEEN